MKRDVIIESYNPHAGGGFSDGEPPFTAITMRTYGHKRMPPRQVVFPGNAVASVFHSHQDRISALLRNDKHADVIADLKARIDAAEAGDIDAEIEMTVDIRYR